MAVVVELRDKQGEVRVLELAESELTIGRKPENHIVLPRGNVSSRHARFVLKDGRMIIVDLKSTNGTFLNGRKVTSPQVIRDTDTVHIGDFALTFRIEELDAIGDEDDTAEVDVTELRLLANIAQQQAGSRMVYADWLEEHGDPVRAEFLRLQELIPTLAEGSHFTATSTRLRELAAHIEMDWRRKVARPLIENCLGLEIACPKEWGSLAPTTRQGVRHCSSCNKQVYYCSSVPEARSHAMAGNCVAVDVVAIRRPGDLAPPPMRTMGMVVPYRDE